MKNKANNKESSKSRRPHGEGSIYQRKDGTWAGVSKYTAQDKTIKKHFVYAKSYNKVAKKKKEWEATNSKGPVSTDADMTLSDYARTIYFPSYSDGRIRQSTYEGYLRTFNAHIKPKIGHIKLCALRRDRVKAFLDDRLEHGNLKTGGPLKRRQVEYIYTILRMILHYAVNNEILQRNVCDLVTIPGKKDKLTFHPWTTEQTELFVESVQKSRLFPLYMVACYTGLRRSEILALSWDNIDFTKGTISVQRALTRSIGGVKFGPPKSNQSRRTICVSEPVINALKIWKKKQATEKLAFPGHYNTDNLVFCSEMGEPFNPERISRTFQADLMKSGLPHIRFHDLRHGYGTMLLEEGVDIAVISKMMGHSSIAVTADIYLKVREPLMKDAASRLAKKIPRISAL